MATMNTPASAPRLKYSKRLATVGAASAALMTLGTASAAVSVVDVNLFQAYGSGFFSFSPLGSAFTGTYDTSYTAGMRNCGLNLLNFNTTNFQWTSALLAAGSVVGSSQSYTASPGFLAYPADGQTVYAGYRVVNQGPSNDETYYGYVQVTGNPGSEFTIDSYSYESSANTAITVVPEVSSFLLGTVGVGALALRRRRSLRG
ncbi:MAG: hypothetical protein EOP85_20755 [Verrucomicrobiaceae bacterium]|nr:MAG: hypothetical protein EOP85_20755 [Verrucomicrobiaceae bacterium]